MENQVDVKRLARRVRMRLGITQLELAALLGISQSQLSRIESGKYSGRKFVFKLMYLLVVEGAKDDGQ